MNQRKSTTDVAQWREEMHRGREKYEFAKSFSSNLIAPDKKYSPPELITDQSNDSVTADIYGFSCLCYYILTISPVLVCSTAGKDMAAPSKKEKVFN